MALNDMFERIPIKIKWDVTNFRYWNTGVDD